MFKDVAKLIAEAKHIRDCHSLQGHLDQQKRGAWFINIISPNKCKVMKVSNSEARPNNDWHLERRRVEESTREKDVGVDMIRHLSPERYW